MAQAVGRRLTSAQICSRGPGVWVSLCLPGLHLRTPQGDLGGWGTEWERPRQGNQSSLLHEPLLNTDQHTSGYRHRWECVRPEGNVYEVALAILNLGRAVFDDYN